jgi:hypothetical protein
VVETSGTSQPEYSFVGGTEGSTTGGIDAYRADKTVATGGVATGRRAGAVRRGVLSSLKRSATELHNKRAD